MFVTTGVSNNTLIDVRVKRYWPGKVPEWANEDNEDDAFDNACTRQQEDTAIVRKDDKRLCRLAERRIKNCEEVARARADSADHRSILEAEIVSTIEEEATRQKELELDKLVDNAMAERRRYLKEKLLQREQEEVHPWDDDEEEEEEEESEY
ncbi:hypothetical protein TSUD_267500 [Trifolium subterraneum]|uniref:Micro-fibrillar-associated protein 1 C-terminal domain-containing protein n=1 Tax=Trifolium subterraneum TaxID=3900 RepID=A0A2Z6N404_TRISU|nr:hypothetical protein TSUD_267500 [Trifolium subterraneum]